MIYKFRLISNENDDFAVDIAIDEKSSFLNIHSFIQKELNYDPMQLASFFITDNNWNKETEITLFDMMDGENEDIRTMDKAIISDFIFSNKQRMLYVYDHFSERAFFMELFEIDKGNIESIQLLNKQGTPPQQIEINLSTDTFEDAVDQFETEEDLDELYRYEDGDIDLNSLSDEDY